jgi:hypothetical protein
MRSLNDLMNGMSRAVHHMLMNVHGGESFMFRELNMLVRTEFKTMPDAAGVPGRMAAIYNENFQSLTWKSKCEWIEETLITLFVIWPLGMPKKLVLEAIKLIPDDVMMNKRVQVSVFIIKKVIQGLDGKEPGTKMDIAALRATFPRISWYSLRIIGRMDEKNDWKTSYGGKIRTNPYPGLMMVVPSRDMYDFIYDRWIGSNMADMISNVIPPPAILRELLSYANKVFLGEESKWMTADLKAKTLVHATDMFRFMGVDDNMEFGPMVDSTAKMESKFMSVVFNVDDDDHTLVSYLDDEVKMSAKRDYISVTDNMSEDDYLNLLYGYNPGAST